MSDKNDILNNSHDGMQEFLETDDEVVNKTNWAPLNGGGKNFKSHKLIKLNDDRLQFRISLRSAIFFINMSFLGFLLLFVAMFGKMLGMDGSGSPLLGGLAGLLFGVVGLFLFNRARTRITVDRSYPALWKGNIDPSKVINPGSIDGYTSLKKLHAIQVIKEFISRDIDDDTSNSFFSYEINLVFHDGKRLNVLDHGDRQSIIVQSHQLADFLGVPLWDACRSEDEEGTIPDLVSRGFQLYGWAKTSIAIILIGVISWTTYQELQTSKEEEKSYQSLPVERKAEIARKHTKELFEAVVNRKYTYNRLKTLVERGAYINEKDDKGRTPLFYAVMARDFDMINFLIRHNADIHIKDNQGVGLKDLLDIKKDRHLYFVLEDAALEETARAQGKTISGVFRDFDKAGNVTSVKVEYR